MKMSFVSGAKENALPFSTLEDAQVSSFCRLAPKPFWQLFLAVLSLEVSRRSGFADVRAS